jgi:hypothetical protein
MRIADEMLPSIRELALCSHPRYPFRATVGKGTETLEQSASLQISFLSEGCPEVVHSGGIFPMKRPPSLFAQYI